MRALLPHADLDVPVVAECRPACMLRHRFGAREARTCWLTVDDDRLFVQWGVAGPYEVSIWTGKVKRTPWRMMRADLAWFRARSRRWAARRTRFTAFMGTRVRDA